MLSDAPPQFSMDEAGGNFRIATTFGEMWASPPTSTSGVYVFDPAGVRIGEVRCLSLSLCLSVSLCPRPSLFLSLFLSLSPSLSLSLSLSPSCRSASRRSEA